VAFVIVDGTGTYSVNGVTFKAGSTKCDDPAVLDAISRDRLDWVYVQLDRSTEKVEVPAVEDEQVPEEPYDTWRGRDGKWYFTTPTGDGVGTHQSDPYDEEQIAQAAAELAREEAGKVPLSTDTDADAPLSGKLTKEEAEATEFPCKEDGCDKVFGDSGARENHERIQKHGAHRPDDDVDKKDDTDATS
jgi:hypothetical protein